MPESPRITDGELDNDLDPGIAAPEQQYTEDQKSLLAQLETNLRVNHTVDELKAVAPAVLGTVANVLLPGSGALVSTALVNVLQAE